MSCRTFQALGTGLLALHHTRSVAALEFGRILLGTIDGSILLSHRKQCRRRACLRHFWTAHMLGIFAAEMYAIVGRLSVG